MNIRNGIIFDTRWLGPHGIGRFAQEVFKSELPFETINLQTRPATAVDPLVLSKYLILNSKGKFFFTPGYNPPLTHLDKTIITVHDLNHIDVNHNSSLLKKIYYNFFLKNVCRKVPVILTVSEFTKDKIARWAQIDSGKIYNVGNGVSSEFNENVTPYKAERPYYLIVGNRKKHKNEIFSLKAYHQSNDRNYDLYFTGKSSPELESYIKENNLQNYVFFKNAVEDSMLASLYKGAHCLLFPSLYEGFGLPVIEAMACGTPVITSNTTSLPEVSGGAALLVDPTNLDEMISTMNRLKTDIFLRDELVSKGLVVSKNYSWDSVRSRVKEALSGFQSI